MKVLYIAAAMLATAGVAVAAEPQTGSGETNGYKLVWQDLFDADQLDTTNRWFIETGTGDNGWGNAELQYYTNRPENIRIDNDGEGNRCMVITARREEYGNRHFTSARVISRDKTTFTHGKLEASIKMPVTNGGLWPAFWTMGNDISQVGWPKCGETDIVEMGHANGMNRGIPDRLMNGATHWGERWDQTGDYAQDLIPDYSLQDGKFHLFTLIWDNEVIEMYLDLDKYPNAKPYYRMTIPLSEIGTDMHPSNYFHKPNFILFNLAIGGNFPGIWDHTQITALNAANNQQQAMYINYVKIYQKGEPGSNEYNAANQTLASLVPGDKMTSGNDPDDPKPDDPKPDDPKPDDPNPDDPGKDGLATIDSDMEVAPEFFTLQGVRVVNPVAGQIYIRRCGNKVDKVRF